MTTTTKNTIEIALRSRGIRLASITVHTPDGRTWEIVPIPAGRGQHADGHWGPLAGAPGGFRLFEIDPDGRHGPNEHDAVDGIWSSGDLVDYLDAVGRTKVLPSHPRTSDPAA